MFDVRNPKYNHRGTIDVEFNHPEYGWIETTLDPTDIVGYNVEMYNQVLAVGGIASYVPPTVEVARAQMPTITRRQLRLSLVRNGISLASVDAAIAGMPEGQAKTEAQIEWADAASFERLHPTLTMIGAALGLSEAQIDAMWTQASSI